MPESERRDITRMADNCRRMEARHGAEAAQEFLPHIHDDLQAKVRGFLAGLKSRAAEPAASAAARTPAGKRRHALAAEAERRPGEAISTQIKPDKNEAALKRCLEHHAEIQALEGGACA
jgi:hypothetical protein